MRRLLLKFETKLTIWLKWHQKSILFKFPSPTIKALNLQLPAKTLHHFPTSNLYSECEHQEKFLILNKLKNWREKYMCLKSSYLLNLSVHKRCTNRWQKTISSWTQQQVMPRCMKQGTHQPTSDNGAEYHLFRVPDYTRVLFTKAICWGRRKGLKS